MAQPTGSGDRDAEIMRLRGRQPAHARRSLKRQHFSTSTGDLLCPLYVDFGRPLSAMSGRSLVA